MKTVSVHASPLAETWMNEASEPKKAQVRFARLRIRLAGLAVSTLLAASLRLPAATQVQWNGQNCAGNFSYANNWNWGGSIPSGFGYELHFNTKASCQTSMYYDWGWASYDNIIYDSSFPQSDPISGNGNGLNFDVKIENDSVWAQTINIPTSGDQNGNGHIELNPVNADLTFQQPVYNTYTSGGVEYRVWGGSAGNFSSAHKLILQTDLIGGTTGKSGVDMAFEDDANHYGIVDVQAAQTWGGSSWIYINCGELWMDTGGSLASGQQIQVGSGSGAIAAKLWLNPLSGGLSFNNAITVYNPGSSERTIGGLNTSGTDTFNSRITLNGQVNLSAATGGTVNFAGLISGSSQNVVVNGFLLPFAGVVAMSYANTYSGNTYISGGTLQFNSGGSAASSPNFYLGETSGSQTATLTLGVTGGGQTLNNPITVRSGSSGVKTISGLATSSSSTLGGNISLNDNLTVSSASGGNLNLNGIISGTAYGLTKTGSGTVTLGNANTYTGNTTVNAGTLLVNNGSGSGTGSGAVTVSSGGILGGNGTVSGAVTIGSGSSGTLSPGSSGSGSIGTLTMGSTLTLGSASTVSMDINKSGVTDTADQAAVTGAVSYGGALNVSATGSGLAAGDSFTLFSGASFSGWFSSVNVPALASGISWDTNKLATTGVLDIYAFTSTALTLTTPKNSNALISAAKLLNHATSVRGTPAVTAATAPGHGTASISGGSLTYSPTASYTGNDSFMITFQDGHGWQTNVVNVTVGSGTGTSPNVLSQGVVGANYVVNFAGIPGYIYTVETNSAPSGNGWTKWGNITASATGAMQVVDPLGSGSLFYRTVWPSY